MWDPQNDLENLSSGSAWDVNKINTIKANLTEMKNSVEAINKKIEDLDKEKKLLNQQEIAARQKEIDEKKLEVDKKKKETQELIKQARDLADLAQDITITANIRKELDEYEKQLKSIQPKSSWFWETVKETWWKTWNRVNDNPWTSLGIWLAIMWAISFFGRKKKKKTTWESTDWEENTEWFWNHGIGKYLKYAGIGIGAFFGIRWLINKFTNKDVDADNHDKPRTQVEEYKNWAELNKEWKEKYESFGWNVDTLYSQVFDKEIQNGWQDDADMSKVSESVNPAESLNWVVPFCMDNWFSSVGNMLSETWIEVDILKKDFNEIKVKVLSRVNTKISYWLTSFISILPSFLQFWLWNTIEEKVKNWLESGRPEDRVKELKFFFREQMRVTVYLQQKQQELIKKIAEEKLAISGSKFSDLEDAMDDKDWMQKEVYGSTEYKSFMDWKILNAVDILKSKNIFNWDLDEDKKNLVHDLDLKRDDMMDWTCWNDIIKRSQEDMKDWNLDQNNKDWLIKSCDKIIEDIDDGVENAAQDSMWNIYKDLLDTDDAVMKQLLENSPFLDLFRGLKEWLGKMRLKLQDWSFMPQDLDNLKIIINEYFAFKKELLLGVDSYQRVKDENGNRCISLWKFFVWSLWNIKDALTKSWIDAGERWGYLLTWVLWAAPFLVIIGWVIYVVKHPGKALLKIGKWTWNVSKFAAKLPWRMVQASLWSARIVWWKYMWPDRLLRKKFFDGAKGPSDLIEALQKWKISLKKASEVANSWAVKKTSKETRQIWTEFGGDLEYAKKKLIHKVLNPWNIPQTATLLDSNMSIITKYFDRTSCNELLRTNSSLNDILNVLWDYETKIARLNSSQIQLFEDMLDSKKMTISEIRKIVDNIENIMIDWYSAKEIKIIADKFAKKISTLTSIDEINDFIKKSLNAIDPNKFADEILKLRNRDLIIFMNNFEANGKFSKYAAEFKQRYITAVWNTWELARLDYELADRLVKDWSKIEDIFELSPEQKNFMKLIDDDLEFLNTRFRKSTNAWVRANYSRQIDALQDLKIDKVPYFSQDQFKYVKNLEWLKLKPRYMAEIFDMIDVNREVTVNWVRVRIAQIIDDWDIEKIITTFKNNKTELWISDELIEFLTKEKTFIAKSFKSAIDWIRKIFRLVASST